MNKIRQPQKSEQIYWMLRRAIVMLEMKPGSPIVEKEICARYDVSRTPVREAVQRLAEEGLANVLPHSGTYVSHISLKSTEEGFVIRRALEVEGIRRAARKPDPEGLTELNAIIARMRRIVSENELEAYLDVDDDFHRTIAQMSGMTRLWKFTSMAKVDLDRLRQLSAPVPGHLEQVTEQHSDIVEAIKRGRPDHAELAMRIHLDSSFEVMTDLLQRHSFIMEEDSK